MTLAVAAWRLQHGAPGSPPRPATPAPRLAAVSPLNGIQESRAPYTARAFLSSPDLMNIVTIWRGVYHSIADVTPRGHAANRGRNTKTGKRPCATPRPSPRREPLPPAIWRAPCTGAAQARDAPPTPGATTARSKGGPTGQSKAREGGRTSTSPLKHLAGGFRNALLGERGAPARWSYSPRAPTPRFPITSRSRASLCSAERRGLRVDHHALSGARVTIAPHLPGITLCHPLGVGKRLGGTGETSSGRYQTPPRSATWALRAVSGYAVRTTLPWNATPSWHDRRTEPHAPAAPAVQRHPARRTTELQHAHHPSPVAAPPLRDGEESTVEQPCTHAGRDERVGQ